MRYCLLVLIGTLFSGCLMEAVTVTAIQGELAAQSAQSGNRALGKAKDSRAKIELESAVNSYAGLTGYYPASLEVLVPNYIPAIPVQSNGMGFGYDPKTGRVSVRLLSDTPARVPQNLEMSGADRENLFQLREAIYAYWEMTGYYPESLESLSPLYIAVTPTMSSGGAFPYSKQTGIVSHPGEHRVVPGAVSQGGQVGSRAAAGGQAGAISGTHSQKQLEVLDELGF